MKEKNNEKEINLQIASSFWQKFKGLMFKKNIDYAIRFKTNAIHTFFMQENIDVVMTDKNNNIIYIFNNVNKNKIIIKKNVYYVYEFPTNFINSKLKKIIIKDS